MNFNQVVHAGKSGSLYGDQHPGSVGLTATLFLIGTSCVCGLVIIRVD